MTLPFVVGLLLENQPSLVAMSISESQMLMRRKKQKKQPMPALQRGDASPPLGLRFDGQGLGTACAGKAEFEVCSTNKAPSTPSKPLKSTTWSLHEPLKMGP